MDVKIYGQVHCGSWSQDSTPPDQRRSLCGNATEQWGADPGYAAPSSARRTRRATGGPIVAYDHFSILPECMRCNRCSANPAPFAWATWGFASKAGQEWAVAVEIGLTLVAKEWRAWEAIVEADIAPRLDCTMDEAHRIRLSKGRLRENRGPDR